MDGPGFHVDVSKLTEASKGIADCTGDRDHFAIKGLPGPTAQYGDDDLHGALADYCDRWSDGLDILTKDAKVISDSLSRVAQAYQAADQAAAGRLTTDPATGVVDG
jgi:hypothetical protein